MICRETGFKRRKWAIYCLSLCSLLKSSCKVHLWVSMLPAAASDQWDHQEDFCPFQNQIVLLFMSSFLSETNIIYQHNEKTSWLNSFLRQIWMTLCWSGGFLASIQSDLEGSISFTNKGNTPDLILFKSNQDVARTSALVTGRVSWEHHVTQMQKEMSVLWSLSFTLHDCHRLYWKEIGLTEILLKKPK